MPLDLAIVGGTVVRPGGTAELDVGVSGGRIAVLAPRGKLEPARETIDAAGKLLLPGAVDAHTHLDAEMFGSHTADDFLSGTRAAAAGGVTAIVDYAFQEPGKSLREGVERWHDKARGRAIIDYGFHIAVLDPTPQVIAELPRLVADGYTSFKIFMMIGFEQRARDFMRLFGAAADCGAPLAIHAEDEHVIGYCTERLLAAGNAGVKYFAASRPPLSEGAAVARGVAMARSAGASAYFVHLSSAAALAEIRAARALGQRVLAETRPIYLYLTADRYDEPQGERYVGYPPLRKTEDVEAIWQGLADGTVDVVATDHCSWTLDRKTAADKFTRIPPGMANLETLLPMLYSEGVAKGRITISRLAELLAENPAKIFGFYPRKGLIAEGSDADLVVFDPASRVVVRASEMHSRAGYDPFEGFEVNGWPVVTVSRGEVIARDRTATAAAGRGEFLARRPYAE